MKQARWMAVLAVVVVSLLPAGAGFAAPASESPLAPGVDLLEYRLPGPVAASVVRVVREGDRYDLRMGFPARAQGFSARATVPEIAARYDSADSPVIAAVNAGFFSETGIIGFLADGEALLQAARDEGRYEKWPVFGWTTGGEPLAGFSPDAGPGRVLVGEDRVLRVDALNRVRGVNQLVCYTPGYGVSTGTTAEGVEVIVRGVTAPLRLAKEIGGRVAEVRTGADSVNNPIPADGFVLAARDAKAQELLDAAVPGERIRFRIPAEPRFWSNAGLLSTGAGWIVRDGAAYDGDRELYASGFISRHPRTIMAWNDRYLYLAAVDGRQAAHSVGMSFDEMARFLIDELAARQAVNLDGGGSTTLFAGGRIVNRPSDGAKPNGTGGSPRRVGNALLLMRRPAPAAFEDTFAPEGRRPGWDDKFTWNGVQPFPEQAPGGDGHVLTVMDPSGGYETCRTGILSMTDCEVAAWVYCELRPETGHGQFERVGIFARDSGHGDFDAPADPLTAFRGGNNYLLAWDSDSGRVRAARMVNGDLQDLLPRPRYVRETGWRQLRIRCEGERIRFWVDDDLLADVRDAAHARGLAGVGYREYFRDDALMRGGRFENFHLALPPFAPLAPLAP